MVTLENYEEYMVLMADRELDAAGQQELEAFLQLHPELREELALFEAVHLVPDTAEVYGNKESLLKKEPRVISMNQWFRYGAAAGLAALIALGIMKWQGSDEGNEIVSADTVEHVTTPTAKTPDTAVPALKQEVIVRQETEEPKEQQSRREQKTTPVAPQKVHVATVREEKKMKMQEQLPERMEIAAVQQLPTEQNIQPQHNTVAVPELPAADNTAPETQRDALAWLPIDEDRKEGLSNIGEVLTARLDKVKEVRDNIRNTDVAVKIGKKELFTIRF
jgi:hypothetical protein